ncbi:hypothetical protein TrLO_g10196 [Triparma laevis f. longispina]|uniref:FAD/NAD(P)-binding domain-containing protein n=1 Tax=Triparma laevis f. longispina TaxID=1714387 RepID=A0A9W7CHR2_9STRA|nr:hypothetical protein TrLO_g10196 [Triparma laevis f. longispina]
MEAPMAVVELGLVVKFIASETSKRLEAARALPETIAKVKRTVGQIIGATEDVQEDKGTLHSLKTIKEKLEIISECLNDLETTASKASAFDNTTFGRFCGLLRNGHDVLQIEKKLEQADAEIKEGLDGLVKATQLATYANRASGVLKEAGARAFWDKHFNGQRTAPLDDLIEALKFEAREWEQDEAKSVPKDLMENLTPTLEAALGGHGEDGESKQVTVLKFGELFGSEPLHVTLTKLEVRQTTATYLVQLLLYRLPDRKVDSAFDGMSLLVSSGDSLATLRHEVKKYAQETLEVEGEDSVPQVLPRRRRLRDLFGLRKDESSSEAKGWYGGKAVSGQGLHRPDTGRSETEGVAEQEAISVSVSKPASKYATIVPDDDATAATSVEDIDVSVPDAAAMIMQQVEYEEATGDTAATIKVSGSKLRLVKAGSTALKARYLTGDHIKRFPPECEAAAAKSAERLESAGDDARALLEAFSDLKEALQKALTPVLISVKHERLRTGRVKKAAPSASGLKSSSKRTRVVVCGGGAGGLTVASELCLELDKYEVVLVDPKEYFEDCTAQCRSICDPGETYEGDGDIRSQWAKSMARYETTTASSAQLVNGLVTGVRSTHIEIGADRTVIPHQQMVAERDAIAAADYIVVVGGGLVGVEIFGDIAENYPGKKISLIHAHDKILRNVKGAHELAVPVLEARDQRDAEHSVGCKSFVTDKGDVIEADKVIWCTGYVPNTGYLREPSSDKLFADSLDK